MCIIAIFYLHIINDYENKFEKIQTQNLLFQIISFVFLIIYIKNYVYLSISCKHVSC